MNKKTLEDVIRHGESLIKAFPDCTEKDPIKLCKKLRRVENFARNATTDFCNGYISEDALEKICSKALDRVFKLLGRNPKRPKSLSYYIFINRDPRGYALKIDSDATWMYNKKCYLGRFKGEDCLSIYTDMGGYGILAPDLNR